MEKGEIKNRAKELLEGNWIEGNFRGIDFGYTRPSNSGPFIYRTGYQQQWLWDSCFHSYINANYFDLQKAKREMMSLMLGTGDKPLVGAATLWNTGAVRGNASLFVRTFFLRANEISSLFTQPPFMPMAVRAIYEKDKDKKYLMEIVPLIRKHFEYLAATRDPDYDFLPNIIHPLESGTDARPDFFEPFHIWRLKRLTGPFRFAMKELFLGIQYALYGKYDPRLLGVDETFVSRLSEVFLAKFNFEDPLFCTVYIENMRDLAYLNDEIGQHDYAEIYRKRADAAQKSLIEKMWDPKDKFFYGLYGTNEKMARIKTIGGLVPIFLTNLPHEYARAIVEHLTNEREFWTRFPIPSCAINEKAFMPGYTPTAMLWRGPSWISTNWMIIKGLEKHNFHEAASKLKDKTISLIEQSGFREYYNPLTGDGYGAKDFGWSTLVVDLLERDNPARK